MERRGKERESGCCPPRLQLAAVSVLRALVSGGGAEYVVAATAAAEAGGAVKDGDEDRKQGEDARDAGEAWVFVSVDSMLTAFSERVVGIALYFEQDRCRKSCHASSF